MPLPDGFEDRFDQPGAAQTAFYLARLGWERPHSGGGPRAPVGLGSDRTAAPAAPSWSVAATG